MAKFTQAERRYNQRARNTLWTAICNGTVKRGDTCESCGYRPKDRSSIHGHHDDYDKPLDVRWLCNSCHVRHHRGLPMIGHLHRGCLGVDLAASPTRTQASA